MFRAQMDPILASTIDFEQYLYEQTAAAKAWPTRRSSQPTQHGESMGSPFKRLNDERRMDLDAAVHRNKQLLARSILSWKKSTTLTRNRRQIEAEHDERTNMIQKLLSNLNIAQPSAAPSQPAASLRPTNRGNSRAQSNDHDDGRTRIRQERGSKRPGGDDVLKTAGAGLMIHGRSTNAERDMPTRRVAEAKHHSDRSSSPVKSLRIDLPGVFSPTPVGGEAGTKGGDRDTGSHIHSSARTTVDRNRDRNRNGQMGGDHQGGYYGYGDYMHRDDDTQGTADLEYSDSDEGGSPAESKRSPARYRTRNNGDSADNGGRGVGGSYGGNEVSPPRSPHPYHEERSKWTAEERSPEPASPPPPPAYSTQYQPSRAAHRSPLRARTAGADSGARAVPVAASQSQSRPLSQAQAQSQSRGVPQRAASAPRAASANRRTAAAGGVGGAGGVPASRRNPDRNSRNAQVPPAPAPVPGPGPGPVSSAEKRAAASAASSATAAANRTTRDDDLARDPQATLDARADARRKRAVELRKQAEERVRKHQYDRQQLLRDKEQQETLELEKLKQEKRTETRELRQANEAIRDQSNQALAVLRGMAKKADRFRQVQLLVRLGLAPWRRLVEQTHLDTVKAWRFRADRLLLWAWEGLVGYTVAQRTARIRQEYRQSAVAYAHYRARLCRQAWKRWSMHRKVVRAKAKAIQGQFSQFTACKRAFTSWRVALERVRRRLAQQLRAAAPHGRKCIFRHCWRRWGEYLEGEREEQEVRHRSAATWFKVQEWLKEGT